MFIQAVPKSGPLLIQPLECHFAGQQTVATDFSSKNKTTISHILVKIKTSFLFVKKWTFRINMNLSLGSSTYVFRDGGGDGGGVVCRGGGDALGDVPVPLFS